jgi:hypothetical protein
MSHKFLCSRKREGSYFWDLSVGLAREDTGSVYHSQSASLPLILGHLSAENEVSSLRSELSSVRNAVIFNRITILSID